jgi:hypothetical protein
MRWPECYPVMTNGHGFETPANKIATAQATLGLAIRLSGEVEAGRITTELFRHDVIVHTGGDGVRVPAFPAGTEQDLKYGIANIVLIALSASALTVDETLDEAFGKTSIDTDPSRIGIRVMVNQLRNAFAHTPLRPKWRIFPKYRKKYPIELDDGSKFTFNAINLDDESIKPEHVGGLEFWTKLLQHCERLVGQV